MNVFALKIKDRFFSCYKNKRITTAWTLAGAKLFTPFCDELEKIEKVFSEKKVKYEKVFIKVAEEEKKELIEPIKIPKDGQDREKVILRFKLPQVTSKSLIEILCISGYRETGNKFSISFNGSKGYLSSFEISCEGCQKADNRIYLPNLYNKDRSLKSIVVNVFYSDEFGVRLSTGVDEPKVIAAMANIVGQKEDELPF